MLLIRPWTIGPCCAGGAVSFYATKIHVEQSSYGFFNRLGRATLWQRLNGSVILEQKDKSVPLPVVMEDEATKMNVEPPSRKPKMAMIDWTSRILMRSFLPQGYPQTVHPFYTLFCSWWFAQNVVGSVLGGNACIAELASFREFLCYFLTLTFPPPLTLSPSIVHTGFTDCHGVVEPCRLVICCGLAMGHQGRPWAVWWHCDCRHFGRSIRHSSKTAEIHVDCHHVFCFSARDCYVDDARLFLALCFFCKFR